VPLVVGDETFYLDLPFYHVRLHAYFVIELKTGTFKPEYAGKLNSYLSTDSDCSDPDLGQAGNRCLDCGCEHHARLPTAPDPQGRQG